MGAALDETDGEIEDAGKGAPIKAKLAWTTLPVIFGGLAVLVIVVCGVLWLLGMLPTPWRIHANSQGTARAEKPSYIDLPDIIANLDTGSHRAVFVKLKARIAVAHVSEQAAVVAEMPRILDTFQTYLRSMRPEEIHGGVGTYRLREALMNRIDILIAPAEVEDLLFVEMLVQ